MARHLPPAPDTPVTARVYLRAKQAGQSHVEVTRAEYDALQAEYDAVYAWKDRHGLIDPSWCANMAFLMGVDVIVDDD